jgi:hypothetical protein
MDWIHLAQGWDQWPRPWGQPKLLFKGFRGCFLGGKAARGVKLAIHLQLAPVKNTWSYTPTLPFIRNLWNSFVYLTWDVSKIVAIWRQCLVSLLPPQLSCRGSTVSKCCQLKEWRQAISGAKNPDASRLVHWPTLTRSFNPTRST